VHNSSVCVVVVLSAVCCNHGLQLRNVVLQLNQVITTICEEQVLLNDGVLPKHCVHKIQLDTKRVGQGEELPYNVTPMLSSCGLIVLHLCYLAVV